MIPRKTFGILCIITGVAVLVAPGGWAEHPINKLFMAAFFLGGGWWHVKKG